MQYFTKPDGVAEAAGTTDEGPAERPAERPADHRTAVIDGGMIVDTQLYMYGLWGACEAAGATWEQRSVSALRPLVESTVEVGLPRFYRQIELDVRDRKILHLISKILN